MSRPSYRQFTILAIDDEPEVLEVVAGLLSGAGYQVFLAAHGEHGLDVARGIHLDLILLDYYLPGLNGLDVLQRLKADPGTQRIPVVALTSATAEYANELSRAGCVAFIPKPFEASEFLRVVSEVLDATIGRRRRHRDPSDA
jgi:CheY-like chemotaxis protein